MGASAIFITYRFSPGLSCAASASDRGASKIKSATRIAHAAALPRVANIGVFRQLLIRSAPARGMLDYYLAACCARAAASVTILYAAASCGLDFDTSAPTLEIVFNNM